MAKGKRAAALFEVIQSDKRFQRKNSGNLLSTPAWFKPQDKTPQTPSQAPQAEQTPADAAPPPVEQGAAPAPTPPATVSAPALADAPPLKSPVQVEMDAERHQIALRMTFASAIVVVFTVLVIVVIAYKLGRRSDSGTVLSSATSEQIKKGEPQQTALEVGHAAANAGQTDDGASAPASGADGAAPTQQPTQLTAAENATAVPPAGATTWNDPKPPSVTPVDDANRIIGYNYVIIQSYPPEEKELALKAKEILAQNGIETTIEQKTSGVVSTWYAVVGIRGFPRVKCVEYEDYLKRIKQVSDQYAGTGRRFKAFKPFGKKWDRPSR